MKRIESLIVKYHQETVGTLALSVDGKVCIKNMICDFFKCTQFFYNSVSIFTVVTFVYPAGMAACCPVKNISGAATMVPATTAPDV